MKTSFLKGMNHLPLVIQPSSSPLLPTLLDELNSERDWLEAQILKYGAVLIRGYSLQSPDDFQRVAHALINELVDYTRGASPRTKVKDKVYTSTDAPRFVPIPLHCELSYTPTPPRRIVFFCHTPAPHGGETPIADMHNVYQALDENLRKCLAERGLRLIQNVPAKKRFGLGKTWQEMFGTDDKREVELACERMEITFTWKSDNSLRLINERPALLTHPETGGQALFTSFYNLHDSWSEEFRVNRLHWLSWLFGFGEMLRKATGKPAIDYPHHCTFADGSEIPREDILDIRNTLRSHAKMFSWQQGDLIVIDNLRVSHGRMPYRGKRKILVAMGN